MMNFDNIPMISQPKDLKVNLFPHQLASIYRMELMERTKVLYPVPGQVINTSIGVNCDMVGYGKTLSMVALVLRDKMEWEDSYKVQYTTSFGKGELSTISTKTYKTFNTTIVLASTSVIPQWIQEFKKAPSLQLGIFTGKQYLTKKPEYYDVIIISPKKYNEFIEKFPNYAWKRFIYDEPTTVKIPLMKTITAGFTWLVTASPEHIYKAYSKVRPSYMKDISTFLNSFLDAIKIQNEPEFVKASFSMPATTHLYYQCHSGIYKHVKGIVNNKIQHMIESGNIEGAISALGGTKTDNIMELVKKNKNIEIDEIKSRIKIWETKADTPKITEWTTRLRVAQKQLEEIEQRFKSFLDSNCPICVDKVNKPVMEPKCQNIFCGSCLMTWLSKKHTCPMCRGDTKESDLIYIRSKSKEEKEEEEEEKEEKLLKKEDVILNLIKKKKDGKFIVFSDFSGSFTTITKFFDTHDISFVELKGSVETRAKKLDNFKFGDVKVIFLNSSIDSTGINIQQATDIILYHSMNDDTSKQIIGRANRVGRKIPLTVHHLKLSE
jgi:hypothetical protein